MPHDSSPFPFDPVMTILGEEKAFVEKRDGLAVEKISYSYNTPFTVLISTIISLRTKEEVTIKASLRLFQEADTPAKMLLLGEERIQQLIYPAGFYRNKTRQIISICHILETLYESKVPDELERLLELPGVGRKTANLVLILGFDKDGICVDTHVHRICNRWGLVDTKTPDETELVLRELLPKRYWKVINGYLVSYGRTVCKPINPQCTPCKLQRYCEFGKQKREPES
jgi:endonuclease III